MEWVVWCPTASGILTKNRVFAIYIGDPMTVLAYTPMKAQTVHIFDLCDPDFCTIFPQFLAEHYHKIDSMRFRMEVIPPREADFMTKLTALIIATNGNDIKCSAVPCETGGFYGWISQYREGVPHQHPLISTNITFETAEIALKTMQDLVVEVREAMIASGDVVPQ